jgi:DNA phosphorothioation-dependent restriction protein DptH
MSVKQFEEFLVDLFIEYADENILPGHRYHFRSPDPANRIRLKAALIKKANQLIQYNSEELSYINLSQCRLIFVVEDPQGLQGVTENFMSHLRDQVAGGLEPFENCALLGIHNSVLDTWGNSAKDLAEYDQVWHPKFILNALRLLITGQLAKEVSECLLEHQFDVIEQDGATMFGFEPLYKALENGKIDFNELGLFDDPLILEMTANSRQIANRLEKNRELYNRLHYEVEHFPDSLENHLREFSRKFIQKNFDNSDEWKTLKFEEFLKEEKDNNNQVIVLECEEPDIGNLISRSRSDRKADQRRRHVLILVEKNSPDFKFRIKLLGNELNKDELHIKDCSQLDGQPHYSLKSHKRSLFVTVFGQANSFPLYFNLMFKRDNAAERYQFSCLVLPNDFSNLIENIKNIFTIDPKKKRLNLMTEESELIVSKLDGKTYEIGSIADQVDIKIHNKVNYQAFVDKSDEVRFSFILDEIKIDCNIESGVANNSIKLPLLIDKLHYLKLFNDNYYGEYIRSKNNVIIDNKEIQLVGRRQKYLKLEANFLDDNAISFIETCPTQIKQIEAVVPLLCQSINQWYSYLKDRNTLPSLVSWGEEYRKLVSDVVTQYIKALEDIPKNVPLSESHKKLIYLGMVTEEGIDYMSPYHPLIQAYYLHLAKLFSNDESKSFKDLPEITLARLNPRGLLPFTYHQSQSFCYSELIEENPSWIAWRPDTNANYSYVRKLVHDKIEEFISAFSHLFTLHPYSSLLLNSINNGNNKEILLGIVDYFKDHNENSVRIHINIYDESLITNEFDHFSESNVYELKLQLGLNKSVQSDQSDTLVDILRSKLTYSKFTHSNSPDDQGYAHISFFRNHERVDVIEIDIDKASSGVACDGLLAGEASESQAGNYYTQFGLRNINTDKYSHLKIARLVGNLIKPAKNSNVQYLGTHAIALAVNENFKTLLEKSYDNSIWITIIDPKVTLDFFHNSKDVVLIHYSDLYTNSSGYDAITVTKRSELYEKVLDNNGGGLVNEFNAFNGEWLLKMLTADNKIKKERIGIIGAYKFVMGMLKDSDITWIPFSVAELIRVSGNVGLKMSDSEFSRNVQGYKKGAISDDILFVGFGDGGIYLLPVEVKTGQRPDYVKAVSQAKELKRYLTEDILSPKTLEGKIYRALFVRQVIMQIEKYQLYNIFSDEYFKSLLDEKESWLRGEYEIADLDNYVDGFVVAHVSNEICLEPIYTKDQNILKIELPISLLTNITNKPLAHLLESNYFAENFAIPRQFILNKKINCESEINPAIDYCLEIKGKEPSIEKEVNSVPIDDEPLSVLFGYDAKDKTPLYWKPTDTSKFMNTNSGIVGTMGTGKTQFTKSLVTQLITSQQKNVGGYPIGILIFDYKSDYVDDEFCNLTNANKYKLFKLPYNPLSLYGDTPMLPVHTAAGFSETMTKAYGLGRKQQLRLENLILECYEKSGIDAENPSTWSKHAPTIEDVWQLFLSQEKVEEDSLYAALSKLARFKIFETDTEKLKTLYELIDGVVVIELATYPSEIQNLIVGLTLDLFYSQMQKRGKPIVDGNYRQITKMLLVDEADNFMSQDFTSLRKILKEGREYGVGIILSTQDITHFKTGENDYSSYILTWIIHRVSQLKNADIKAIFNIDDKSEQDNLMENIRKLEKHFSLYVDGAKKIKKMKDKPFYELIQK